MPWPAFCELLQAAGRLRAREQQAALAASAYPHMKVSDQRRLQSDVAGAARGIAQAVAMTDQDAAGALELFKAVGRRHRQLYGALPEGMRVPMKGDT